MLKQCYINLNVAFRVASFLFEQFKRRRSHKQKNMQKPQVSVDLSKRHIYNTEVDEWAAEWFLGAQQSGHVMALDDGSLNLCERPSTRILSAGFVSINSLSGVCGGGGGRGHVRCADTETGKNQNNVWVTR